MIDVPTPEIVADVINEVFRMFSKAELTYGVGLAVLGSCVTQLIQTADDQDQRVTLAIRFTRALMDTVGVEMQFAVQETGDEPHTCH